MVEIKEVRLRVIKWMMKASTSSSFSPICDGGCVWGKSGKLIENSYSVPGDRGDKFVRIFTLKVLVVVTMVPENDDSRGARNPSTRHSVVEAVSLLGANFIEENIPVVYPHSRPADLKI
jgi:hypothetical protein